MVVIRLARGGAKKKPFYHIVAADKRMPRDGRYIEQLGYFEPVARGKATRLSLNQELIQAWIAKGAQPSPRVQRLIKEFALGMTAAIEIKKPAKPAPKKAEAAEATTAEAAPTKEAKPAAETEPKEAKTESKPAAKAADADSTAANKEDK